MSEGTWGESPQDWLWEGAHLAGVPPLCTELAFLQPGGAALLGSQAGHAYWGCWQLELSYGSSSRDCAVMLVCSLFRLLVGASNEPFTLWVVISVPCSWLFNSTWISMFSWEFYWHLYFGVDYLPWNFVFSHLYADAIAESSLYKCVLKPLKEAINSYLKEIHNKDGSLQQLKENQLVIQNTTTTDLGVTTSVPETVVLEKILHKFTTMHKAYSPEKKIAILLKSCKLIYDSMAQGNPGTALLLTWYSTRVLCQVPQEQGLCYCRCGNIQTVCVWYQLLYLGVFGISSSQVVFRLHWLVSVKFSALIADTRCFLVNFKLHNSRDQIMSVSVYFMGNSHLAQAFMQLSINPQSSVPADSSLMVTYRHGSLGRVSWFGLYKVLPKLKRRCRILVLFVINSW